MTIFRVHTHKGEADFYGCTSPEQALRTLKSLIEEELEIHRVEYLLMGTMYEGEWVDVTPRALEGQEVWL